MTTIHEQLAALRLDFAARLPAKVAEVEAAVRAAQRDPAALVDAVRLAHRLGGSAGSYGHVELGEAIRRVEDLLVRAPTPWDEIARALATAIALLSPEARP